jgi:hypothetical protein
LIISGAAQNGKIHFDDVNLTANFTTLRAVWQFCQANDVFTVELARQLAVDNDSRVTITSLKLGVVKTNIRREFPRWMQWLVPLVFDPLLTPTPQEAAESALRLLLAEDLEGVISKKGYDFPCSLRSTSWIFPVLAQPGGYLNPTLP